MLHKLSVWLCILSIVSHGTPARILTSPRSVQATPTINPRGDFQIDAVVPTTKGQIGINPIESDLGDPETYIGSIYGTDTQYITLQDTTTKWIGVNTNYLSMEGTSTVEIVIATATAAANGQNIGDISIILPEGLADALSASVETAITACGGIIAKRRLNRQDSGNQRRQADAVLSCVFTYAELDTKAGGLFDSYNVASELTEAGIALAEGAASVLTTYIASLGTKAQVAETLVWLAAYAIGVMIAEDAELSGQSSTSIVIGKLNFPVDGFATSPPSKGCTGDEPVTIDSYLCTQYDCQGEDTGLCTIAPNVNCPCIPTIPTGPGAHDMNITWLNYQQEWLTDIFTGADVSDVQNSVLRVMPLGDSITYGYQSSTGNGYRLELLTDVLASSNNSMNYVGSVQSGTMADNYNEGHSGATIDQIASFTTLSLGKRPNVVLLHAGTNDMNLPVDPANAPTRLGTLIDLVLATCPDAVIIVAQIIASANTVTQANIITYNAAIPDIVAARVAQGYHVTVVDMFSRLSLSTDYTDDLHPNDVGYSIMGDVWYEAIAQASGMDWITPPVEVTTSSTLVTCDHLPTWYPQGEIANGAGLGADSYPSIVCIELEEDITRCSCSNIDGSGTVYEQILTGNSCAAMGYDLIHAVHFADLNGDGRAEYLWVDIDGAVTAFLNLGSASTQESSLGADVQWLPQGIIATGVGAARHEVQFADLNGDGRAEYLWVHADGSVEAWLNLGGPNDGANAAQVSWLYSGIIATGTGAPGSSVSFADLNGDGRAEYLSTDANGVVTCYLNLGSSIDNGDHAAEVSWLAQGVIATGTGGIRNNTVFADINGDGRADYLSVTRSGSGAVSEWQNGGGPNDGPNAAQVVWYPQGQITTGDGSSGANVLFADLNGDGRAEYIEINPTTSAATVYMNGCA